MKESKLCQHNHDDYQSASTASTDKQSWWRQTKHKSEKQRTREEATPYRITKKNDIKFHDAVHGQHTRDTLFHSGVHAHIQSHPHSQACESNFVHIKSGKINWQKLPSTQARLMHCLPTVRIANMMNRWTEEPVKKDAHVSKQTKYSG